MNINSFSPYPNLQKILLSILSLFILLGAVFLTTIEANANNILDYANSIATPKADFDIVSILARMALLILLITIYWIVLNKLRQSIKKWIPVNQNLRLAVDLTITIGTVFLIFFTLIVTFSDHLGGFFTILGLISTALVFTLQDFVASFFGWFQIKLGNLYMTGDEITLHTGTTKYTGKVLHTGIFRTVLKIRRGDDTLDKEQFTGKVVSFPNHLVLKDGLNNSTKTNRVLWHHFSTTITFESDHQLARSILQSIIDKQFQYSLDHDQISDRVQAKKLIYKPKVYIDISPDGARFTIWFACNINFYREIIDSYSSEILSQFKESDIELAYPTHRIVLNK